MPAHFCRLLQRSDRLPHTGHCGTPNILFEGDTTVVRGSKSSWGRHRRASGACCLSHMCAHVCFELTVIYEAMTALGARTLTVANISMRLHMVRKCVFPAERLAA
jgi:hypothetical protein